MKRFLFPLERVRHWRAGQARLEEMKLEQLQGNLVALREERQNIEIQRAQSELQVLGQPSMQASELQSLDAYRVHARTKIQDIGNRERQAEVLVEEQRQRVIQAQRNAELLERLKQKALDEWRVASDREQESLAGELYLAKRVRRR
jgi:hypothetical protein